MKRLFAAALLALTSAAFGTTLSPITLLNPAGSTTGQAIISTGATSAPAWGTAALAPIAANTLLGNSTGSTAVPAAVAVSNCVGASSALNYTAGSGFGCNATINAVTLGGATFASPGPIGSVSTSSGAFSSISAPSATIGGGTIDNATIGATAASTGKFTTLAASGLITPSSTNGIKGTATNDSANAGSVGEIIANSSTGTSLTSGTTASSTSISLTAGDWDVEATNAFVPAGTTVMLGQLTGVNTSIALGATGTYQSIAFTSSQGSGSAVASPVTRISLSTTTTVFAIVNATFTTSTCTVNGFIRARRVR
jgi:hypothetical protein